MTSKPGLTHSHFFPVTVSAHFGWIRRVKYGEDARSGWSIGAGVGVFVPFVDFN